MRRTENRPDERRFVIRIDQSAAGYVGRLSVVEAGGHGSERVVSAESCAELVAALSIVTALAIDPNAKLADGAAAVETTAEDRQAVHPDAAMSPTADSPEKRADSTPGPTATTSGVTTAAPRPGPSIAFYLGFGLGLDVTAPGPLYFPTGSILADATLERASAVSPSVGLAVRSSLEATASSPSGHATFTLTTIRIEPCPIRLRWSASFGAMPCLAFDGGFISATGHDVEAATSRIRPWLSVGAGLRLLAWRAPRVGLDVGVTVPLYRDTFRFTPSERIYELSGPITFVTASIAFGPFGG